MTTALDKTWHPEHFVCVTCGKPFGRASFYAHEGKPYCKACYVIHIGPCCAVNGHPIEGGRYLVKDGLRYCEAHYWERFGVRCVIGGEDPQARVHGERLGRGVLRGAQPGAALLRLLRPLHLRSAHRRGRHLS